MHTPSLISQMAFEVEDLEANLADPSKGTAEVGTFFFDSEGNLIGIA